VLPRYRSRFSKRQFTQPQLLTILCLMRYEDWAFREAEVRLSEHRELRQVLGLGSVQDSTTLYRFLQRLDDQTIDHAVGETVRRLRGSLRQKRQRARVAVDATGLAQGAVSTFFVRRMHHHGQKPLPWRRWLKWVVAVDLDQQFVLSQLGRRGPWNDCANLPAVVEAASKQTRIGLVLAEADGTADRGSRRRAARAAAGLGRAEVASAAGAGRDSSSGDHRAPDFIAAWFGARTRPVSHGSGTLRAARAEPVVADGFQKPGGMGRTGGAAVGAGRSQSLRDCSQGHLVDEGRASKTAADRSVCELRRAGGNADGPRDAVVEHESSGGLDVVDGVDHAARNPAALQRVSTSADTRKSGTFSRSVGRSNETPQNPGGSGTTNVAG
jgi:hypothetical protein